MYHAHKYKFFSSKLFIYLFYFAIRTELTFPLYFSDFPCIVMIINIKNVNIHSFPYTQFLLYISSHPLFFFYYFYCVVCVCVLNFLFLEFFISLLCQKIEEEEELCQFFSLSCFSLSIISSKSKTTSITMP